MSGNHRDSLRRIVAGADWLALLGVALLCVGIAVLFTWPWALVLAGVALIADRIL